MGTFSSHSHRFALGRLTVELRGAVRAYVDSFDLAPATDPGDPDLCITLLDGGADSRPGNRLGALRMAEASVTVTDDALQLWARARLPWHQRMMPDPLYRFVHPAHLSRAEYGAQLIDYQLVDGLAQVANVSAGQTFLHAAVVADGDRRVAIVADGGMGKTGTLLELVDRFGWRYGSDDWTVITNTGDVHHSHRPLHVFPRNLTGRSDIRDRLLSSLGPASRWSWRLRERSGRLHGLRRHVPAAAIFGEGRSAGTGPLTEAVLVERGDVDHIIEQSIETAEIAHAAAGFVAHELAPALAVLDDELAELTAGTHKDADALLGATETVMNHALSGCVRTRVLVPQDMPEAEIERYLIGRLTDHPSAPAVPFDDVDRMLGGAVRSFDTNTGTLHRYTVAAGPDLIKQSRHWSDAHVAGLAHTAAACLDYAAAHDIGPFVAPITHWGPSGETEGESTASYIATEWIDGQSLTEWFVDTYRALPKAEARDHAIAMAVRSGAQLAHYHRAMAATSLATIPLKRATVEETGLAIRLAGLLCGRTRYRRAERVRSIDDPGPHNAVLDGDDRLWLIDLPAHRQTVVVERDVARLASRMVGAVQKYADALWVPRRADYRDLTAAVIQGYESVGSPADRPVDAGLVQACLAADAGLKVLWTRRRRAPGTRLEALVRESLATVVLGAGAVSSGRSGRQS